MEIEVNQTSMGTEKKDDSHEVKDVEVGKSDLTNTESSVATSDHEDDRINDKVTQLDGARETINQDGFKKPSLLIGPRRGKPGQYRVVSDRNNKEISEPCHTAPEINLEDDGTKSSEQAAISISEKQQIPLQYKEPSWSGRPDAEYKIEVLKSGVILEIIDIHEKNYHVIGRLPTCDISLAHPTISRYHAILQYRDTEDEKHGRGFYLYDLGSTHGTFWNGCRIRPNTYVRLQGGHMMRFGCSQRKLILQTPPEDVEEESELSVTELKEKRRLELFERETMAREQREQEEEAERLRIEKEEQEGISWGMGEDADEDTDLTENPYALTNNEELFLDDPKKTLRGWFEREGHELQYETEEKGIGQFLCWVDLPIDGIGGRTVRAEAIVKGKKKESVIQCALEACRILDRHGVLRQATHEARKRKTRNWEEEDFYDSDEDNFLDRTGTVEKKREQRMRQAGKLEEKVETYASLLDKHTAITKQIVDIESRLKKSQKLKECGVEHSNEDALDAFMSSLNSTIFNKADVTKMKLELQNLRKEEEKLLKLVNITKPANLPLLTALKGTDDLQKPKAIKHNASTSKKRSIDDIRDNVNVERSTITKDDIKKDIEEDITMKKKSTNDERTTLDDSSKSERSIKTECAPENSSDVESKIGNVDALIMSTGSTEKGDNNIPKKKKKNQRRMQHRAEKAAKGMQKSYEDETYSDDYSMWLPPQNQTGDGKTNLNDKYGY